MKDEIIEQVRNIRKKIENECSNEGITFEEHVLNYQKQFSDKLVSYSNPHGKIVSIEVLK